MDRVESTSWMVCGFREPNELRAGRPEMWTTLVDTLRGIGAGFNGSEDHGASYLVGSAEPGASGT